MTGSPHRGDKVDDYVAARLADTGHALYQNDAGRVAAAEEIRANLWVSRQPVSNSFRGQ
jgi:hypothetical protein